MNHWKMYMALIVSVIVVVALAACAPVKESEAPATSVSEPSVSATPTAEETIELTLWTCSVTEESGQWYRNWADDYTKTHPNVHVKMEFFEQEAYRVKLMAALAAGTTGDIFYSPPYPDIYRAAREGKLFPVEGFVNKERLDPATIGTMSVDGKLFGMPLGIWSNLFYYSKAAFRTAGVDPQQWADPLQPTWDEFAAAADALKAAGITPIALGNAPSYPGLFYFWAFHHRLGGWEDLQNAIFGTNGGSFDSKNFIRAAELAQELDKRGWLPEGFNAVGEEEMVTGWLAGRGAMLYMGSWLAQYLGAAPAGFEYGIFEFPSLPDGDPKSKSDTLGGVEGLWIAATSKHPEAAAAFLDTYADKERALSLFESQGNVPPVRDILPPYEGPTGNLTTDMTLETVQFVGTHSTGIFSWYDHPSPAAVTDAMYSNSQALLTGKLTPEEFAGILEEAAKTWR